MQKKTPFACHFHRLDELLLAWWSKRRYGESLRVAAHKYCRAVRARQGAHFAVESAHFVQLPSVGPLVFFDDVFMNQFVDCFFEKEIGRFHV